MNEEVRLLFHAVVDLSPEQRERYFGERQVAAELRAEVESLLAFDSAGEHLATEAIAACAGQVIEQTPEIEGVRCGPYRLLELLGHGGMGAVYLAERADGEVEQRAAIKLLRYRESAHDFQIRFLRERQILARLNHPAIARLLDAGHTSDGQPYLAMEYVDGVPIDQYAEKLDVRGRLELFIKVCDAVSYAHRNLIVHRDLKPSNILVDREGRPKLLDFGIAKILNAESEGAERTTTVLHALTPQYASPEQVCGEPITTASDVYSLGVVLYRLLTGRLPYEFPSLAAAAIAHTVSEVEPAPPGLGEDLDNILFMALRKEPARRYVSVQHLADDIGRALADRPVMARPDTIRYRAGKFIRRNRLTLSAAALAMLAILIASAVSIEQGRIAQRRFEAVRKLAHIFVFDLHDEIANLEGSTKAREMMVRTGLEYLDRLAKDAGSDLDLQREIAEGYIKIGDAQGYPTKPNLGRIADALASYRKAGDIYRRIAAKDAAYLPDVAEYYLKLAGLVRFTDNLPQARDLSMSAVETFDRARKEQPFNRAMEMSYLRSWCIVGDMDEDLGHYRQTWTDFSRCYDLARAQVKQNRDRQALSALSQAAERMGTGAQSLGFLGEALHALDEDEAVLTELLAAEPLNPGLHRRQALVHHYRSMVYYDDMYPSFADPKRGLESATKYLQAAELMVRSDPNNTSAQFSLAIAKYRLSLPLREFNPKAAVAVARDSIEMFDRLIASQKASYLIASRRARALQRLAEAELKAGLVEDAQRSAELALAAERPVVAKDAAEWEEPMALVQMLLVTAEANTAGGNMARAEAFLREAHDRAVEIAKRGELTSLIPLAHSEQALAEFYVRCGRMNEARDCYRRLIALWQHAPKPNEYSGKQESDATQQLAALR